MKNTTCQKHDIELVDDKCSQCVSEDNAPSVDKKELDPDANNQQASNQKDAGTLDNTATTVNNYGEQVGLKKITNIAGSVIELLQVTQEVKEEALLSQVSTLLPPRSGPRPHFILESIEAYFDQLLERRLILISCQYNEFALDASHALIDKLGITDAEQKRWLDLQSERNRDKLIWIRSFLPEDKQAQARTAIVVNALHSSAQNTLDALIADVGRSEDFKHQLKENGVYVLCIVESAYIDERQGDPKRASSFPHWQISFLQPLLKQYNHEDMIEKILRQREEGKWSKDDTEFCSRIVSCLLRDQLRAEIERLDRLAPPIPPGEIFKADDPILKPVLFMATYFRDLTAQEFSDSVECLLGDREIFVSTPEYRLNGDGTRDVTYNREKLPLVEVWRENKDSIMWERLCETYSASCSTNVIDFSDHTLRDSLKDYLGQRYSLLVKDQFKHLQNHGFLFYKSDRVAENMIEMTMQMLSAYPDDFNKDSIIEIITTAKRRFESEASSNQTDCNFLKKTRPNTPARIYSRVCELMQQMLMVPQMKELVDDCLAELMKSGDHASVLELVRRLRFASETEKFHWIKLLLDQGNTRVSIFTYSYLYNEVRKSNAAIFDRYELLDTWLPEEDREIGRYPRSGSHALRSLIEYCLDSVESFDQERYGQWPSEYRLFTFTDSEEAARSMGRLMKWLFRPAMIQALQQLEMDINGAASLIDPITLVGALISEWFFILVGPERGQADNQQASNPKDAGTLDNTAATINNYGEQVGLKQIINIAGTDLKLDQWQVAQKEEALLSQVTTSLPPRYDRKTHDDAIAAPDEAQRAEQSSIETKPELDAASMTTILLKQAHLAASKSQRRELLKYWEQLKEILSDRIRDIQFSREEGSASWRAKLTWKRNRLRELIKAFRNI